MSQKSIDWGGERVPCYILGTAQLGSEYGIANKEGKPDIGKAELIIKNAWDAGARVFDTAAGYGESEYILGRTLKNKGFSGDSRIITKISPSVSDDDYLWVECSIEKSLKMLENSYLWAVLLHRYDMLKEWDGGLGEALLRLKVKKKVSHLGVSVYTTDEVKEAMNYPDMEIIQAPCNLWSPALFTEGIIKSALEKNKLIIVRSLFLQGLLLMSPEEVRERLPRAYSASLEWHEILRDYNAGAWEMCMRFAASLKVPVILGADNEQQAYSNGSFSGMQTLTFDEILDIYEKIRPHLSEEITNPVMWK